MIFRLSRPFGLVMLISEMLWMSVSVFGQGDIRDSLLSINDDPRPLAAVADLLERKLGLPISYEDVRWAAIDSIRAADHPASDIAPVNGICSEAQDLMYSELHVLNGCSITVPTSCDTTGMKTVYPVALSFCSPNTIWSCSGSCS